MCCAHKMIPVWLNARLLSAPAHPLSDLGHLPKHLDYLCIPSATLVSQPDQPPFSLLRQPYLVESILLLCTHQATDKIALRMVHGSEVPPLGAVLTSVERLEMALGDSLSGYTCAAFKAHRRPDQQRIGRGRWKYAMA